MGSACFCLLDFIGPFDADPRTECVQRCVERNTVVCMDTGTGKTLIAVKASQGVVFG